MMAGGYDEAVYADVEATIRMLAHVMFPVRHAMHGTAGNPKHAGNNARILIQSRTSHIRRSISHA